MAQSNTVAVAAGDVGAHAEHTTNGRPAAPDVPTEVDVAFETWRELGPLADLAEAEAGGWASAEQVSCLESDREGWVEALHRLLTLTGDSLVAAEQLEGPERNQVVADFRNEFQRLADALYRVNGERRLLPGTQAPTKQQAAPTKAPAPQKPEADLSGLTAEPALHASWAAGRIVIWAGAPAAGGFGVDVLDQLIADTHASSVPWKPTADVRLPNVETGGSSLPAGATARSAPVEEALGWLVGVGTGDGPIGPSLQWMSEVARWGTELVAQGRMVPTLRRAASSRGGGKRPADRYRVRWIPALVDSQRLADMVSRVPGSVMAIERTAKPEAVCRTLLGLVVDAVCRAGAGRLVTPATAQVARSRPEVAETMLSSLDGTPFNAVVDQASALSERISDWSSPVTGDSSFGLMIHLDPPEDDGGWLLAAEVTGVERQPMPIERALTVVTRGQMREIENMVQRAERLVPAFRRPSTRRGQVVLSGDEAAELLFGGAMGLIAAGFDVRLPAFSSKRPRPKLRLSADEPRQSAEVGVRQLSNVRWSVLFGDTELDAKEIARLAAEAKPLVQVNGRWVEVDQADLAAAASALREKAGTTQMSGAAIVRAAVGLEGGTLGGPVDIVGSGWAVDLIRGTTQDPPKPLEAPPTFRGELRGYQAEAAGWLAFLDRADLGGCLAMDMGLGKTPTVLAHLLATRGEGPALVVCPPAVLGNWANEAARFTPGLQVEVHHGTQRSSASGLAQLAKTTDVVLTTYTTAMRDVDLLEKIEWRRVIVDEAQAIKNPSNDTAQALRRIPARSRIAMTGTPVENGLGDLWAILDYTNPGLVGPRKEFVEQLSRSEKGDGRSNGSGEQALKALNGLLVFRRTKAEPAIAAELSDKIDVLDHCTMTPEQVGLYQAIINRLIEGPLEDDISKRKAHVLAAITHLKQVCDHPAAYLHEDDGPLVGRSGKLERLEELVSSVFASGERILVFTHFATWGEKMAAYLSERTGVKIDCYHGGLSRGTRDKMVQEFQTADGPGALVLSLKAGGAGLNLTAASHVVLYDRWWNPAVEDQARDRAWRIGQKRTVISHRLVCPGTIDERVEEVVAGKRHIASLVLPASSSLGDIDRQQLRTALGLSDDVIVEEAGDGLASDEEGEAA